ncbi:MAG TPA: HGGxSTG domain-containing protein [Acetobacteraceae bacterium]|nr:HGGxSTG domain-containing protein [Acetobacteraceae bacterium]
MSSSLQPATAVPTTPPAVQADARPPTTKHRGNPSLALAPRCGARTRAGCPCRAPAIRGKLRCRMHGGRSTGPRTTEGRARIAAARTIHGRTDAKWRAFNRRVLRFAHRARVYRDALHHLDRLPPDLAARFQQNPPELRMPPYPTGGITAAADRAMQRAEAVSLAPSKQAIALARQARRANRAGPSAPFGALTAGQPEPRTNSAGSGCAEPGTGGRRRAAGGKTPMHQKASHVGRTAPRPLRRPAQRRSQKPIDQNARNKRMAPAERFRSAVRHAAGRATKTHAPEPARRPPAMTPALIPAANVKP